MDLNMKFIEDYSVHFIADRRRAASQLRYGNGSFAASIIGVMAASVRRAAATIETWARGTDAPIAEDRLPRLNSAR
ncbi:MAG: hypothetical protein AB7J35_07985 [Dehalococcoidia bacterium]